MKGSPQRLAKRRSGERSSAETTAFYVRSHLGSQDTQTQVGPRRLPTQVPLEPHPRDPWQHAGRAAERLDRLRGQKVMGKVRHDRIEDLDCAGSVRRICDLR